MKQITGNKLLVKALKEEGVEYLFGYPGACTIDISDELYKQDEIKIVLPPRTIRHYNTQISRCGVVKAYIILSIQPVWCNKIRAEAPYLICFFIHKLCKALRRAAHMFRNRIESAAGSACSRGAPSPGAGPPA